MRQVGALRLLSMRSCTGGACMKFQNMSQRCGSAHVPEVDKQDDLRVFRLLTRANP